MIPKHFLFICMAMLMSAAAEPGKDIVVHTIGDSTMANKEARVYPETGWCQVLPLYVDQSVQVRNHAVNGRSTKSFINEGRWKVVLDSLKPGDYVFIQFGHNDQKDQDSSRYTNPYTGYRKNLVRFVNETRDKGAIPVLLTSIVMRNFNDKGTLIDTHGAYPEVMRCVAKKMQVILIDTQLMTEEMVLRKGVEGSKAMYLHVKPGEYDYYPQGKEDNTHLSENGAKEVAAAVAREIAQLPISLAEHINVEK
jgi:lysophospholipase L1-like esterase